MIQFMINIKILYFDSDDNNNREEKLNTIFYNEKY